MKKIIVATCLAFAALASAPASATNFALPIGPGTSSANYGNSSTTPGAIADAYSFTVPLGTANGLLGSLALTSALDANISGVFLDGTAFTRISGGSFDFFTLSPTTLSAGTHSVFVNGQWGTSGGSYAGTLNYVVTAVPEPATWALMIGGFGMVGGTLRRRKTSVRVTYG